MSPPRHPAEAIEHVDELRDEVTRPASINKSSHSGDAVLESRDATESAMAKPAGDSAPEIEFTSSDTGISGTEKSLDTHPEETDSKDIVNTDDEATSETATTCAGDSNELMETSTATLRPETAPITQPKPLRHENLGDEPYLDPTPPTPIPTLLTRSLSAASVASGDNQKSETAERSPTRSDAGFDERHSVSEDEREKNSKSEIQTIMDQFSEEGGGPGEQEVMSPRLELATPLLGGNIQHPPRKSSLEPLNAAVSNSTQSLENLRIASTSPVSLRSQSISEKGPAVPPKPSSMHGFIPNRGSTEHFQKIETPPTPGGGSSLHRPPPPEPEPEPNLPFDFHRFLEQLRHKTADPVAKFLRSFLTEFGKKQWMVHEQVKIISDFLAFITNKMAQCEVWREVSDAEFDNAREGMEKLVMNRLYTQTFSPAIPPPQPIQGPRSKRKNAERPLGPGRRGQHQEDVERDDILAQKVSIYGWVREEHLDIPPVGESGKRFLVLAQQELLKIKTYRAPRDKIICVLNCCKVIFGLLKHSKSDSSADSFMPLLIYVVLQANPEHLVSNVQYILRFRNQEKLGGEAGYYLSSLMGAIQFIESLDRTSLTISDEEFEKNVEAAVLAIAEKHPPEDMRDYQLNEKGQVGSSEVAASSHGNPGSSNSRNSTSSYGESSDDENAPVSGLLRTIQKPLSSIGRIFSDESTPQPIRTPLPTNTPRLAPARQSSSERPRSPQRYDEHIRGLHLAQDAAARQASAEAAEAQRLQRAEHANVVETLAGMFPDLDREVISDVVTQKEGRVGLAVDACLALSS